MSNLNWVEIVHILYLILIRHSFPVFLFFFISAQHLSLRYSLYRIWMSVRACVCLCLCMKHRYQHQNQNQSTISTTTIHCSRWQQPKHRSNNKSNANILANWLMTEVMSCIQRLDHFIYPCLWCYFFTGEFTERLSEQRVLLIKDSKQQRVRFIQILYPFSISLYTFIFF